MHPFILIGIGTGILFAGIKQLTGTEKSDSVAPVTASIVPPIEETPPNEIESSDSDASV